MAIVAVKIYLHKMKFHHCFLNAFDDVGLCLGDLVPNLRVLDLFIILADLFLDPLLCFLVEVLENFLEIF